jgi:hypothetical protein
MEVIKEISSTIFVLLEAPVGISKTLLPWFRNTMKTLVQTLAGLLPAVRLVASWASLITLFLVLVSVSVLLSTEIAISCSKADPGRPLSLLSIVFTSILLQNILVHSLPNSQMRGRHTMHGPATFTWTCGDVTKNMV